MEGKRDGQGGSGAPKSGRRRRRRGGGGGGGNNSQSQQVKTDKAPETRGSREGRPHQGHGRGGPQQGQPGRGGPQQGQPGRGGPQQGQPGRGGSQRPAGRNGGGEGRDRDKARSELPPTKARPERSEPPFHHVFKRYGLVSYETFQAARADIATLQAKAREVDQLNIVIHAEGNMDDAELNAIGNVKVFAGNAWTIIHERRNQEGWYDEPR